MAPPGSRKLRQSFYPRARKGRGIAGGDLPLPMSGVPPALNCGAARGIIAEQGDRRMGKLPPQICGSAILSGKSG